MSELPTLGVGLGYRQELHDAVLEHRDDIDWLEIVTDSYLDNLDGLAHLRRLREEYVLVPHSLELSVGSDEPVDEEYLSAVAHVAEAIGAPWVSDHLCFTHEGGVDLATLMPVLRTRKKARSVAAKAQMVQERLGRTFLLENITYYVDVPAELTEQEFIAEVLDHCDCGLLLDLNNVIVNATNHGFEPRAFVDGLPLDRVVQVHLAGNSTESKVGDVLLDGHDAAVSDEVFDLLGYLVARQPLKGALIERDELFPADFAELARDLRRARSIVDDSRRDG